MSLLLAKELFQACTNSDYAKKRLTFAPDVDGYNSSFLYSLEGDQLEIIIFKSTAKKMFKECHDLLNNNLPFENSEY